MKKVSQDITIKELFIVGICALLLILVGATTALSKSEYQEAMQQTEDEWQAVRQTMQQGKKSFDTFREKYQEYEDAVFGPNIDLGIELARKIFKLDKSQVNAARGKRDALRDMFNKLDKSGLKTKLKKTADALKFADGVAGEVSNVWEFSKKFDPENAKDNPTYGLRLIGDLLKDGAGKLEKIPIVGQSLGKLVSAYAAAAGDYANALDRLDKKIAEARGGSLCGQLGKNTDQQKAFFAAAQNGEDCQSHLVVGDFPRLQGEAYEGDSFYFLYSPQSKTGYFSPVGATIKVYNWHALLLERKALYADWLASQSNSITAEVEKRAREYYTLFSGWEDQTGSGRLIIERLNLVQEADFYGALIEEQFIANYIIASEHHKVIENIMKQFREHVLLSGTIYESDGSNEILSFGAKVELTINDQIYVENTNQNGNYTIIMKGKLEDRVYGKVSKENFETIERDGRMHQQAIVGENYTLFKNNVDTSNSVADEEGMLTDLKNFRDRTIQLSTEVCTDAATATANMEAIGATTATAQASFSRLERSIQGAVETARNIESIEASLAESHQMAEGLAVQIGDDTALAGARRQIVCQAANAMKICNTNSDRDQLYAEAMAAHIDVKPAFERARANSLDLEGLNGVVKEKLEKLTKAQQVTNSIGGLPEDLTTAKNDVSQKIAAAEALLLAATETKLPEIKAISHTAEDLSSALKKRVADNPDSNVLMDEIDMLMAQISVQYDNANGCLEEPKNKLEAEKGKADLFLNRYSKLEINFNRIKKTFSPGAEGSRSLFFDSALEKANLADLLISMGGGYIRTCAEHLVMAKACMNTVDQLSTVDFSVLMPSVVGMACQDGAYAVAVNKVGYQVVSSGLAPHPDWEFCVEATEPAGGTEVSLIDGIALISCFEELDIPFYLATVDCSWLPGGTAVYDHGQRVGICDCINGLVFNSSETRCINCEEYFQAMLGAFNAGDLDTAQAWVDESRRCPWVADAQGQINEERHRRLCAKLMGNIQSACQNGNAQAANGALSEAYSQKCQVDPQLQQWVVSLVNAYNQQVRENQAQQQVQQRHNLQNVINLITQGINAVSQNNQKPSSNNETGGSNSNSSSGSGSNNKSDDGCGGCPPGYMCLLGVCNK